MYQLNKAKTKQFDPLKTSTNAATFAYAAFHAIKKNWLFKYVNIMIKKQIILNLIIFLSPIIIIVLVNEYSRFTATNKGYIRKGITAINSGIKTPEKCSWHCYSDTGYCKRYHTNLLKNYTSKVDPIYFGVIKSLHSTGDYGLANIIFLVILFPIMMYVLLIKSIAIQRKIKKLKNG